ncbi:MAG: hypothetical protein ABFD15_04105 [Methanofastidiosum sp.]
MEINNKGKCPICGIYGKLTMHGACPKCQTILNYDSMCEDDDKVKESDNDFWGDSDYPM